MPYSYTIRCYISSGVAAFDCALHVPRLGDKHEICVHYNALSAVRRLGCVRAEILEAPASGAAGGVGCLLVKFSIVTCSFRTLHL